MNDGVNLWTRLLEALRDSGTDPDPRMTPAELGRRVAALGDDRVLRFVLEYYYPRVFGKEPGTLDEASARELVASMERRPPAPVSSETGNGPCPLCGENVVNPK